MCVCVKGDWTRTDAISSLSPFFFLAIPQSFIEQEPEAISATSLSEMTGERLRQMLAWERDLPQQEERARLLREVK